MYRPLNMWQIKTYLTILCVFLAWASPAAASILDTDPYCEDYGCVVVSDGINYDIYDVYDIANDICCVADGARLIPRSNRFGDFNETGKLTPAPPPSSDESMLMAITDGAGNTVASFLDDGDGFLDAGDAIAAFSLDPTTRISLDSSSQAYSHSFFISSRNLRFSMKGFVSSFNPTGDLASSIGLDDIQITPRLTKKGVDQGYEFGKQANGGGIKFNNNIQTLADLSGIPADFAETKQKKGIRKKAGSLGHQSVRFDFLYQIPDYDMSMGTGSLIVDVEFEFYKER